MKIIATIFLSLFHLMLFGQAKNCNTVAFYREKTSCYLIPSGVINDTFNAYLPLKCDLRKLDSTVTGVWKVFLNDSSKIVEIITTEKGRLNGVFRSYFKQNGQISIVCNYINDTIIGDYISFYENGKINFKGFYNANGFNGFQYEYWDSGRLAHSAKYTDGGYRGLMDEKFWDLNGKSINYTKFSKLWYQCD